MQTYRTRAQLKQDAKNTLKGNWGKGILLYLITMLYAYGTSVYSAGININNALNNPTNLGTHFSTYGIVSTIIGLLFGVISTTADYRALDWIRNPQLQFQPVISNFARFKNPDWYKMIGMFIIVYVLTALWSLLLVIPGIIKSFSYSQTYFIYKDLSDKGQAGGYALVDFVTKSRQLMDGHKADLFVLYLSFIGWFILGGITLGIGFIWIIPYMRLTLANFYRDLVEKNPNVV